MLNIILDSVLIFLIVYALLELSSRLMDFIVSRNKITDFYAVLPLNGGDSTEYIIRRSAAKCEEAGCRLLLINRGMSDNELFIAQSLCGEFEHMQILSAEEFYALFAEAKAQTDAGASSKPT